MKKQFFLTLLVAGMFSAATAQSTKQTASGVSFGIRAGLNLQNINGRDLFDNKLENKLVPRLQAGVVANIPLADEFYLQPGVLYSGKGAKEKGTDNNVAINYVEVPITFLFKPVLGTGHLLLGVGPYVGYAMSGKVTEPDGDTRKILFENEVTAAQYVTNPYLRRLDAGANLLFGYELSSKLSLQLNAQLGLTKINPAIQDASENNIALRNTGYGLSLGYRF